MIEVINAKGCAIRGRKYAGKAPALEVRKDWVMNCLDSLIEKDCLVLEILKCKNDTLGENQSAKMALWKENKNANN